MRRLLRRPLPPILRMLILRSSVVDRVGGGAISHAVDGTIGRVVAGVAVALLGLASVGCQAAPPEATAPDPARTAAAAPRPTSTQPSAAWPAGGITPTAAGAATDQGSSASTQTPPATATGRPDASATPTAPATARAIAEAPSPAPSATLPAEPAVAPTATRSAPVAPPSPAPTTPSDATRTTETWRQVGSDLGTLGLSGTAFDGREVRLAREGDRYSASGQATSPVRESSFPFDAAILSWNADAPAGAALKLELRVRVGEEWSGWYTMGTWGKDGGSSVRGQSDRWGRVEVDTLKLRAPASALQYRATLTTANPGATPSLRLVAVAYSSLADRLVGPKPASGPGLGRDLDVPRLSQLDQDPSLAWEVCSPTSLTMVLRYWGIGRTVPETIRGVRDAATGIYGNWPLNAGFAGSQGLEAHVDRFHSLEQLQAEVAAGRPVVASVRWRAGELDNAPVSSAESGHLIVVRGFTPQGDVIVNDPLGRGEGVRRVYKRAQFVKIWLGQGGVVYLIRPAPAQPTR